MRRQGELTAKERRQFEGLVRDFMELDTYDPHTADQAPTHTEPIPIEVKLSPSDRLRWRWHRWRLRRAGGVA